MKSSRSTEWLSGHRGWTAGEMLQLIRQIPEPSRARLVEHSGLAASTVAARVEQLVALGLVTQAANDRGGRNPRLLSVNDDFGCVAAVDIGSRHARLAIIDMSGGIIEVEDLAVPDRTPDTFVRWLSEQVLRLHADLREQGRAPQALLCVGLSVPAPVNLAAGTVVGPTRVPEWHDVPLAGMMADVLGIEVLMDNDATLMALAEHRRHHETQSNMLFVKLGSGIGCGVIVGGEVYRGDSGGAGDIGHVSVDVPFARACRCGRTDCLESSVGGLALINELRARGVDVSTLADFARAAQEGNPEAVEIARIAGSAIGEALAIITNFFNPAVIVVGGGLSTIERLYTSLLATLYDRALPIATLGVSIEPSRNAEDAGIRGAGLLALESVLGALSVDSRIAHSGG